MTALLWFARLLAIVGYCGIVFVAGHFSPTAAIAVTVLWLLVFGRLFKAPAV